MKNILILGNGTQGLSIAKDINLAGFRVMMISGRGNYADVSRYVDLWIPCIVDSSSEEYLTLIKRVIIEESVDTIIPMGDVFSEFMSRNKAELQKLVPFEMPDIADFERGTNKNSLMSLCKEKGYPHPLTISTDEIPITDLKDLPYPMLIKPNVTCGARGMTLCQSYEELSEALPKVQAEYGDCHLQKYVKQGGAQVEVQLYVNANRELVNSSVIYKYRWYPEKGGSSCCAKSVRNEKIVNILFHALLDLNWVGFADFDTIEDPNTGELLIMEINPRVPACVKCPIEAGIKWGEIIVNGYLGLPQKEYEYKEGEFLRHLGFEALWFFHSPNRFRTKPCMLKFFGRHIHYQDMSDWTDPKPFFFGTWRNVKKVMSHTEKQRIAR